MKLSMSSSLSVDSTSKTLILCTLAIKNNYFIIATRLCVCVYVVYHEVRAPSLDYRRIV